MELFNGVGLAGRIVREENLALLNHNIIEGEKEGQIGKVQQVGVFFPRFLAKEF